MDVGGNQVRDCRVAASEEDIRPGGLEVVVVDPQWPGSVQRVDGLRVARAVDEIGQVGVDDRAVRELELDPAPNVMKDVAVEVAPVDDDVMSLIRQEGLGGVSQP